MKLEKQFDNVEIMFEGQIGQIRYDELNKASKLCVEIAENFAIGFAEWISVNGYNIDYFIGNERLSELLEIYKKTL